MHMYGWHFETRSQFSGTSYWSSEWAKILAFCLAQPEEHSVPLRNFCHIYYSYPKPWHCSPNFFNSL